MALVDLSSSTGHRLIPARSPGRPFGRFDELGSTCTGVQRHTVVGDDLRPTVMGVSFGLVGPGAILGLCYSRGLLLLNRRRRGTCQRDRRNPL